MAFSGHSGTTGTMRPLSLNRCVTTKQECQQLYSLHPESDRGAGHTFRESPHILELKAILLPACRQAIGAVHTEPGAQYRTLNQGYQSRVNIHIAL